MAKKRSKVLGCLVISLSFILFNVVTVFAATATSDYKYVSGNGYNYKIYSSATANSSGSWGGVTCTNSDYVNVPAGYFGVLARLYNSSGALVKSGSWYYNDSASGGFSDITGTYTTKGTFYGCGQVKLYNGSGYTTYTTYQSPNVSNISTLSSSMKLSASSTFIPETSYDVNENGETYGSGLSVVSLGEEPDLIKACGVNNVLGYVRSEDFGTENPNTPEEAVANQNTNIKTIPLYDKDGKTVIGSFIVSSSQQNCIFY